MPSCSVHIANSSVHDHGTDDCEERHFWRQGNGALLTGGVTMLATGLSQEDVITKATCANCGSTWLF